MLQTSAKAKIFFRKFYSEIWNQLNPKALEKYYDRSVIAVSSELDLTYDCIYARIKAYSKIYTHQKLNVYKALAKENNIIVWFEQQLYKIGAARSQINIGTMANYTIKDDKILRVEFMWDKPTNIVLPNIGKTFHGPLPSKQYEIINKLSKREIQCLYYLMQAYTAKQIASHLNLSYRTIEDHIVALKDKLGIYRKNEIVEYAINNNLLLISPLLSDIIN